MVIDPLEGRGLDLTFLKECVEKVRSKYEPKVLILSEADFRGHIYLAPHGYWEHFKNEYRKLGLERIVWAEDVSDGEFLLSSGAEIEPGVETIHLTSS